MTQPNRRRVEGEGISRPGKPKARRVSPRKELAVVTLGMVAAISGIGGLLAANPPSWAAETAAVSVEQTTAQQGEKDAWQASEEAAREAAARAEAARKEPEQAAQQNGAQGAEASQSAAEQYAAEQAAAQAAAEQAALEQQAVYSAQPQGAAAAVSQGS